MIGFAARRPMGIEVTAKTRAALDEKRPERLTRRDGNRNWESQCGWNR